MFFKATNLLVITIIALISLARYSNALIPNSTRNKWNNIGSSSKRHRGLPITSSFIGTKRTSSSLLRRRMSSNNRQSEETSAASPSIVVFDLDGCLWRPEMYELIWFSNGKGGPFRPDPSNPYQLLTTGNEPVYLLGNVREVMADLYDEGIQVGISSRTDEPDWARELLQKFTLTKDTVSLQDVIGDGPIEIAKDSKIYHFQRISQECNIPLEDMIFFDNESGNCREVAKLGVTVAYCPDGVTNEIYQLARNVFPQSDGKVIGIDVYGYDTLEGAQRLY